MRVLLFTALILTAIGCSDFDPRSLLNGPRVLGVVAEPPEVVQGDTVTLTAIEYGDDIVEREWSLCLISLGVFVDFACLDDALIIPLSSSDASVSFSLTPDDVDIFGTLAVFAQGESAMTALEDCGDACVGPDGEQNPYFDVQVKLDTRWADGTSMTTYKTVRVRFDDVERNINPDISELRVNGEESAAPVQPGSAIELSVSSRDDVLQRYVDSGGRAYDEELTLTWYTTAGEFSTPVTFGSDLDTTLTLPTDLSADEVDVLVVARDGRGGTDYLSARLSVTR